MQASKARGAHAAEHRQADGTDEAQVYRALHTDKAVFHGLAASSLRREKQTHLVAEAAGAKVDAVQAGHVQQRPGGLAAAEGGLRTQRVRAREQLPSPEHHKRTRRYCRRPELGPGRR